MTDLITLPDRILDRSYATTPRTTVRSKLSVFSDILKVAEESNATCYIGSENEGKIIEKDADM